MSRSSSSFLERYAVAPLAVGIAIALRWPLNFLLDNNMPFMSFWPAILLCAWFGGIGPGLLSTVLSGMTVGIWLLDGNDLFATVNRVYWFGILFFILLAGASCFLIEYLHRNRREVENIAEDTGSQADLMHECLSNMPYAVLAVDTREEVTLINPAAANLAGWEPQEALGQPVEKVFRLISDSSRKVLENPVSRVIRESRSGSLSGHGVLHAHDGSEESVDYTVVPFHDAKNKILGAVLACHPCYDMRSTDRSAAFRPIKGTTLPILVNVPGDVQLTGLGIRILLVEPDADAIDALKGFLVHLGHDVTVAASRAEGIGKSSDCRPQVVIADIRQADADCLALPLEMRRTPANARARMVALSDSGSDDARKQALDAGFDHFLAKPVDAMVLQSVVALQSLMAHMDGSG